MSQIEGPNPPSSEDPTKVTPPAGAVVTPPASLSPEQLKELLANGQVEEFNRLRPNKGIVFEDLNIRKKSLDGANLSHCTFRNCCFHHCSMSNVDISSTKFESSSLMQNSFAHATGLGVSFAKCEIAWCRFFEATLSGAIFDRTIIESSMFARASLLNAHLQHCTLTSLDFDEVKAAGSKWFQCDLRYTSFRHALLTECWFAQSRFNDSIFPKATMTGIKVSFSYFMGRFTLDRAVVAQGVFQESMFDKPTWKDGEAVKGVINPESATAQTSLKTLEKPSKPGTSIDGIPGTNQELYDEAMRRLAKLVGLDEVKREMEELAAVLRINKRREHLGLPVEPSMSHYVFSGPPGTGKTTVARILGDVLKSLGYLTKGQFIETDRAGLVGRYLGETAIKTQNVVDSALGGVLFIDEAYALSPINEMDSYAQEAVSTLLKLMEDKRKELVVIAAGYGPEMRRFIDSNPGLQSRFSQHIHFKSFTTQALTDIFVGLSTASAFVCDEETTRGVTLALEMLKDKGDDRFGNARVVRNLLDKMARRQSVRLLKEAGPMDKTRFSTFVFDDIPCQEMLNISTERFRKMMVKAPANKEQEFGVYIDPKLKFKGDHFPN